MLYELLKFFWARPDLAVGKLQDLSDGDLRGNTKDRRRPKQKKRQEKMIQERKYIVERQEHRG